jgi:xanthine/uracil/vitamin C permease (AzgA family)
LGKSASRGAAFLTLITIPLTFSIANGLAFGIISRVPPRLFRGRGRTASVAAYTLAALLIVRLYLGQPCNSTTLRILTVLPGESNLSE